MHIYIYIKHFRKLFLKNYTIEKSEKISNAYILIINLFLKFIREILNDFS